LMIEKPKHLSRRHLLGAGAAAGAAAAFAGPVSRSPAPQIPPGAAARAGEQLVFVNARIHTMDSRNTIANTVSVVNGRFSTVGGTAPRRGPGIRLIDLK